jgi:Tol biopolymer transport system component
MVTGRAPFPGTTAADTIAAILSKQPRELSDFLDDPPQKLVSIVDRCLQKDREARYRSMDTLLMDLRELRSEAATGAVRVNETAMLPATGPLRSYAIYVIGFVLLLVAGGAWFFVKTANRSGPLTVGALRNVPITSWSSMSVEAGSAASFSPDARMVAFASTKSGASEIWSKPSAGGDVIQVTRNGFYNQYPVWSPDGQQLAFFSKRGTEYGIWRVSFTGGQETQITKVTGLARPMRWHGEGLLVQDGGEIYDIDIATGSKKRLTDLSSAGIHPRGYAVHQDGVTFAISVKDERGWKIKLGKFGSNTLNEVANSPEQIDDIAFGPNDTTVYYTGTIDGLRQIFRVGSKGDSAVQISSGNNDLSLQDVSVDGAKVLYSSIAETADLWSVNLTDKKQGVIANEVALEYWPEVSPDGKNIAFESVAQADHPFGGSVVVKDINNSGPGMIVATNAFSPVWSNDGQWVAFFRRTDGAISIWRARANGTDLKLIASGSPVTPGYTNPPYLRTGIDQLSWSPDNAQIAYAERRDPGWVMTLSPVEGGELTTVLSSDDPKETFCCAKWRADGKLLMASSDTAGGSGQGRIFRIWIAAADGTNKRVLVESRAEMRCLGLDQKGQLLLAQRTDPADVSATPKAINLLAVTVSSGEVRSVGTIENAYLNNIRASRDGSTIAYVTRSKDTTQLYTMNSAGGTARQVFTEDDPKVLVSAIAWAPDGQSIVFGKQTRTNLLSMLTN